MTTASINKITESLMPVAIDIDSVKEAPKNARKHSSAATQRKNKAES